MAASRLEAALDLMRRMPPDAVPKNLARVIDLAPDLEEDLVCSVDQPLRSMTDPVSGREFLICDYNRDRSSYRSPWSNKYFPTDPGDGAPYPSTQLRELEKAANEAFDTYRELYYEGGTHSVYMWDLSPGFAACLLFKKKSEGKASASGVWDSIHVVQVETTGAGRALYKLTSTVILSLVMATPETGDFRLGGSMTRRVEKEMDLNDANTHLMNIGRLVEDMENKMRQALNDLYFSKTQEVLGYMHRTAGAAATSQLLQMQRALHDRIAGRAKE